MNKYNNACVYKIYNKLNPEEFYIGSTIQKRGWYCQFLILILNSQVSIFVLDFCLFCFAVQFWVRKICVLR